MSSLQKEPRIPFSVMTENENEDTNQHNGRTEKANEETTLTLLHQDHCYSKIILQDSGRERCPQRRSKKHKNRRINRATEILKDILKLQDQKYRESALRKLSKKHKNRRINRATGILKDILKLQDEKYRESTLRKLSNFLLEKREEDPDNYYSIGHVLYNSCSTMTILLQELLTFFKMMDNGSMTARASKRLTNVLTLFQCIAAGRETRDKFVISSIPNFLVPLVIYKAPLEEFENVRAVALSVIGILCQARESNIIQWAVESDMVEVCLVSLEIGNELSKVVGMHIIEAILQDDSGLAYICNPKSNRLKELMTTWYHLVTVLDVDQDFSPRLLFHVIRCCFLLCNDMGGYDIVRESLPDPITNGSFHPITEKFPVIGSLLQELLLTIDKIDGSGTVSEYVMIEKSSGDSLAHLQESSIRDHKGKQGLGT